MSIKWSIPIESRILDLVSRGIRRKDAVDSVLNVYLTEYRRELKDQIRRED